MTREYVRATTTCKSIPFRTRDAALEVVRVPFETIQSLSPPATFQGRRWRFPNYYVAEEKFCGGWGTTSVESQPVVRVGVRIVAAAVIVALATPLSLAQVTPAPPATAPATSPAAEQRITLDFPADGMELRTLADIVTRRLKIP